MSIDLIVDSHQSAPSFSSLLPLLAHGNESFPESYVTTKNDYCLVPLTSLLHLLHQPTLFPNVQKNRKPLPASIAMTYLESITTTDKNQYSCERCCPVIFCSCEFHRGKVLLDGKGRHLHPHSNDASVFWLTPLQKVMLFLFFKRVIMDPLHRSDFSDSTPASLEFFLSVCTNSPDCHTLFTPDVTLARLMFPFFNLRAFPSRSSTPIPLIPDYALIILGVASILAVKSTPFLIREPSHVIGVVSTVLGCLFDPHLSLSLMFRDTLKEYLQYSCILKNSPNHHSTNWFYDEVSFLQALNSKIAKIMYILTDPQKAEEERKLCIDYTPTTTTIINKLPPVCPSAMMKRLAYPMVAGDLLCHRWHELSSASSYQDLFQARFVTSVSLHTALYHLVHLQCNIFAGQRVKEMVSRNNNQSNNSGFLSILPTLTVEPLRQFILTGTPTHFVYEWFQREYAELKRIHSHNLMEEERDMFDVFPVDSIPDSMHRSMICCKEGFLQWITAKGAMSSLRFSLSPSSSSSLEPPSLTSQYGSVLNLLLYSCVTVTPAGPPANQDSFSCLDVYFIWRLMYMLNILFGRRPLDSDDITLNDAYLVLQLIQKCHDDGEPISKHTLFALLLPLDPLVITNKKPFQSYLHCKELKSLLLQSPPFSTTVHMPSSLLFLHESSDTDRDGVLFTPRTSLLEFLLKVPSTGEKMAMMETFTVRLQCTKQVFESIYEKKDHHHHHPPNVTIGPTPYIFTQEVVDQYNKKTTTTTMLNKVVHAVWLLAYLFCTSSSSLPAAVFQPKDGHMYLNHAFLSVLLRRVLCRHINIPVLGRKKENDAVVRLNDVLFLPFLPSVEESILPFMRYFYARYHKEAIRTSGGSFTKGVKTVFTSLTPSSSSSSFRAPPPPSLHIQIPTTTTLDLDLNPDDDDDSPPSTPPNDPTSPRYTPTGRSPRSPSPPKVFSSSSSLMPSADLQKVLEELDKATGNTKNKKRSVDASEHVTSNKKTHTMENSNKDDDDDDDEEDGSVLDEWSYSPNKK